MDARDYAAEHGGDKGKITFTSYDADDNEVEHELPTRFGVCPLCQGKGTHVNPSIDAHGIGAEEFAEDPDFAEDYFSGRYDQTCNECHGNRVIHVVDESRCDSKLLKQYEDHLMELAYQHAEQEAERRMGA